MKYVIYKNILGYCVTSTEITKSIWEEREWEETDYDW